MINNSYTKRQIGERGKRKKSKEEKGTQLFHLYTEGLLYFMQVWY